MKKNTNTNRNSIPGFLNKSDIIKLIDEIQLINSNKCDKKYNERFSELEKALNGVSLSHTKILTVAIISAIVGKFISIPYEIWKPIIEAISPLAINIIDQIYYVIS